MFIEEEILTGDGTETEFALADTMKFGTVKVLIDDKLCYEFYESENVAAVDPDPAHGVIVFLFPPSADQEVIVSYYTADEPNTLNQIHYITPAQALAQSRVSTLTALTSEQIAAYIAEVEAFIDEYVGNNWRRLFNDNGQALLFPREEDAKILADSTYPVDYSGIPYDVTKAALYALENVILTGVVTADSPVGGIISESIGDYSYSRAQASRDVGDAGELIGKRARVLLNKFKRNFRKLSLDDNNYLSEAELNSRQRFSN